MFYSRRFHVYSKADSLFVNLFLIFENNTPLAYDLTRDKIIGDETCRAKLRIKIKHATSIETTLWEVSSNFT